MKRKIQILLLILVSAFYAKAQSLDLILQKYYEAVGMQKLQKVESIRYEGYKLNHFLKKIGPNIPEKLFKPDFKISVDNKKRYLMQDIGLHGEGAYGFSDGEYWKDPAGFPPEKWNPGTQDRLLIDFWKDIEGFLFDYHKKGHELIKLVDVSIERKKYYRLQMITNKKDTLYYYLNPKTYLLEKLSFGGDITTGKEFPTFTFFKIQKY